jgi:hypothetical protein
MEDSTEESESPTSSIADAQVKKLYHWKELRELPKYSGDETVTPNHFKIWSNWVKNKAIAVDLENDIFLARK